MTTPAERIDTGADRPRRRGWMWWTGSIIVHLAALTALALSPALRRAVFGDPNAAAPPLHTSAARIAQARATLDRLTRERIVRQNTAIIAVAERLRGMRAASWEELLRRAEYHPALAAERDKGLAEPPAPPSAGDLERDDVPTLYGRARVLEEAVFRLYEQHRAIGLTLASAGRAQNKTQTQAQPLATSLELAAIERPPRPDLDLARLAATPTSLDDGIWLAFKAENEKASDTAEIMANNARRIVDVIEGRDRAITGSTLVADTGVGVTLERWTEKNDYVGETLALAERLPSDLESVDPDAKIVLGRHLGDGDLAQRRAEWLALDTWWTVGPFAYEGGQRTAGSLRHAYPPELGIDLDAVYVGKGGRSLQWTWRAFDQVRMEPRKDAYAVNAIWYWYTEFASDSERELWVNVASDDYSTLWWNGEQVYSSGMEPRPWVVLDARQFVKVKVRKGVNAVLLKLDNGKGTTGFSVILNLGRMP